jgi:hypothetical protein
MDEIDLKIQECNCNWRNYLADLRLIHPIDRSHFHLSVGLSSALNMVARGTFLATRDLARKPLKNETDKL